MAYDIEITEIAVADAFGDALRSVVVAMDDRGVLVEIVRSSGRSSNRSVSSNGTLGLRPGSTRPAA